MIKPLPSQKIIFFVDGASQGNPGHAGIGVVVYDDDGRCIKRISKYIGKASNNVAEYSAINLALSEAFILKAAAITIKTDSELVARQLSGQYKVKSDNLKPLYIQARHLIDALDEVKIVHIKRHLNKEADRLATLAVDKRTS